MSSTTTLMRLSFLDAWQPRLLGPVPALHPRMRRVLASLGVYGFAALAQVYGMLIGRTPPTAGWALLLLLAAGMVTMVVLARTPAAQAVSEVAFTVGQTAFAVWCLALAYTINPDVRGMLLMIVGLALVHGAFELPARYCMALGWMSVLVLGAVMALMSHLRADVFDPVVETVHFLFCLVTLPTVAHLAAGMSRTRVRLVQQQVDLHAALDHIGTLTTLDELTGLPNRRHVQDLLTNSAALSAPAHRPLAVCLFNLDHFHRLNDTLGHAAADEALRRIGSLVQPLIGESDVLARWDGDEFLLLLPDTSLELAQERVACLRLHFADPLSWGDRPELQVTFSGGLVAHRQGEPVHTTLERAALLMRSAKLAGRGEVFAR